MYIPPVRDEPRPSRPIRTRYRPLVGKVIVTVGTRIIFVLLVVGLALLIMWLSGQAIVLVAEEAAKGISGFFRWALNTFA